MHISTKMLEARITALNTLTNQPAIPYTRIDGKVIPNPGNYHLSQAYGGYCLQQMVKSGGCTDVLSSGHTTKRDLFNRINAYRLGIEAGLAASK